MVFGKDGENTIEDECKVFFAVQFGKEIPKRVFLLSLAHNRSLGCAVRLVVQCDEQDGHTKPHQRLSLFARPQPEPTERSEFTEPADYPCETAGAAAGAGGVGGIAGEGGVEE